MRFGVMYANVGPMAYAEGAALRALWSQPEASHHSEYSSFERAISRPQPTQDRIPIVVGGHSQAAARRAGRLGDGFFPSTPDPELLGELLEVMRTTASEHGRDPDTIEVTVGGYGVRGSGAVDQVAKLADLGVSRVIIPPLAYEPAGQQEAFARFGEEVMARC